jgi:hypothetical protein
MHNPKFKRGGDLPAVSVSRTILLDKLYDSRARLIALNSPEVLCDQSSRQVLDEYHLLQDMVEEVMEPGVLPACIEASLVRERP